MRILSLMKLLFFKKNGKFLDLEGKALQNQNQCIQKGSGVYHLSTATDVKYFDKDESILIRLQKVLRILTQSP
ncbi:MULTISPECIES: hypothetical protein [spotted fever group]|uniref:Uncharacterized protein n=2 Tax=spotted fever group TaxID=114277 RepID=A0A0F3PEM4_RICRH|nr:MULTISPECIES: hypothetical protein [spotted fever group]AFB32120.1 hypothetical protein RMB_07085 [Rickettsia massiliae str. AZT80]KJV78800.1 hypothetical protein RMAECT_0802 [Rickettsia rhipicephali str. Ect]